MEANEIRAAAPTGSLRKLTLLKTTGRPAGRGGQFDIDVTIIEHGHGILYAGSHPAMLSIAYYDIVKIGKVG